MAAANYSLALEQGATFRLPASYGASDGATVTPYDITGCTLRMQIRQAYGAAVLASAATDTGEIVITDAANGKFVITLTATVTDAAFDGIKKALYDLELVWPSGDVVRLLEGKVTIDPNITRDTA